MTAYFRHAAISWKKNSITTCPALQEFLQELDHISAEIWLFLFLRPERRGGGDSGSATVMSTILTLYYFI